MALYHVSICIAFIINYVLTLRNDGLDNFWISPGRSGGNVLIQLIKRYEFFRFIFDGLSFSTSRAGTARIIIAIRITGCRRRLTVALSAMMMSVPIPITVLASLYPSARLVPTAAPWRGLAFRIIGFISNVSFSSAEHVTLRSKSFLYPKPHEDMRREY